MAKPWTFSEFESHSATVQSSTQATDDLMGVTSSWVTKTSVGSSGVITGSLQTLNGSQQSWAGRSNMAIDFVFFPQAGVDVSGIVNGDRLLINGGKYAVVWRGNEGGTTDSPVIYVQRVE